MVYGSQFNPSICKLAIRFGVPIFSGSSILVAALVLTFATLSIPPHSILPHSILPHSILPHPLLFHPEKEMGVGDTEGISVYTSTLVDEDRVDQNKADDPSVDFVKDVLPIFQQHCLDCHGAERQESNLRLDLKESAMGIADWGEVVIEPKNSDESLLFQFITGEGDMVMPPPGSGEPLTESQIETIRQWIDQGADWPDEFAGTERVELTSDHWSFQPIRRVVPPEVKAPQNFPLRNSIDRFVAAKLAEHQLTPSPPAEPATLIRRLTLGMHGLLPTPERVTAFEQDASNSAYEALVDEILANPHYGERWARHWLDVVRFGESTGFEVNRDRSNAYYYRDYVIQALNNDLPFNRFIVEQLAGDALDADEATGFLVGGPYDIVKSPDINLTLMQREDELDDYVNTTSTAFLGLTVSCARCHNHKFDPILQRDYYAMQAVFAGVSHGERRIYSQADDELKTAIADSRAEVQRLEGELDLLRQTQANYTQTEKLLPPVNAKENVDSFEPMVAQHVRFSIQRTNLYEPCLDELEIYGPDDSTNLALAINGGIATSSGDYVGNPKHQLHHINDGVYGNDQSWICSQAEGWVQISLPEPRKINRVVWGRDRQGAFSDRLAVRYSIAVSQDGENWTEVASSADRQPFLVDGRPLDDEFIRMLSPDKAAEANAIWNGLAQERKNLSELEQKIPVAYIGEFREAKPVHRLHRGDPLSPREEVEPDALTLLGKLDLTSETPEQQRRLKLAQWMASDDHPLTARVIVNRVWHYHFGKGLVATTSDFGINGEFPSHPELLDWLTSEFIRHGWSLKWLHREILTSSTYRQSSRPREEALAIDADSRLLWRFPPRRLEAEAIRDCILQASGKLDLTMGGPGFLLFEVDRENVHHYFPLETFEPQHFRRMIYMTKIRQEQDDVFGQFDCPDAGQIAPNRNQSTTPLQALNLFNSPFAIEQAEFFATRLESLRRDSVESQVILAYQILFSRDPSSGELQQATQFIQSQGLPAFCRAILNANEFLYLS